MAYVGTPIDTTNQFQSLQGKRFSGNASTTAFTLDIAPNSVFDIEVFVENVRQDPNSAYTLNGTTLTFSAAPPSGTNNIYVIHQAKAVGTITAPVGGSIDMNGVELILDEDGDTSITADTDDQIDFKVAGNDRVKLNNSDLTLQTCAFRINNSTTGTASSDGLLLEVSGSDVYFNQKEDADIYVRTNNSDRIIVQNDGHVNFSTNMSENDYRSNHSFNEHSTGKIGFVVQHSTGTDPFGMLIDFSDVTKDNNSQFFMRCDDSTTERLYIYSDGDIQNHDNSYGAISDVNLKEQITDASSQWDDIKNLRVRKFKFKTDVATGDSDAHWRLGLVAQEAETVSPNLVKTNPKFDKHAQPILDSEGNQKTEKSIKYSILYMKAVKALQEAMTKIEDLEARVKTLEG